MTDAAMYVALAGQAVGVGVSVAAAITMYRRRTSARRAGGESVAMFTVTLHDSEGRAIEQANIPQASAERLLEALREAKRRPTGPGSGRPLAPA